MPAAGHAKPERALFVAELSSELPRVAARHAVKPQEAQKGTIFLACYPIALLRVFVGT